MSGLIGTAILLANKQVSQEAREILYQENSFVFGFNYAHDFHPWTVLSSEAETDAYFEQRISEVKDHVFKNNPGDTQMTREHKPSPEPDNDWVETISWKRLPLVSDYDYFISSFVSNDPFVYFLNTIGRENTSFLQSVKYIGMHSSSMEGFEEYMCMYWASKKSCHSIQAFFKICVLI